jgi:hypothetical protein
MKIILREERPQRPVPSCDLTGRGSGLLMPSTGRPGFFPYAVSAVLHVVCLGFISVTTYNLPSSAKSNKAALAARAVIIRLPQQVFLPKPKQKDAPGESLEAAINRLTKSMTGAAAARKISAPPQPVMLRAQQILIQPQYPLELAPPPLSPAVPSMLVLAGPPVQQPVKTFTPSPIRQKLPSAQMQEPMKDVRLSARITDAPESLRVNAVTLPVARPMTPPMPKPVTAIAAGAASETHPISVLSISDAPVTSQTLVVPPGNIVPKPAEDSEGVRAGSAADAAATTTATNTPAPQPQSQPQLPVSVAGNAAKTVEPPKPAPALPMQEIIHAANGRFNMVVIQSSPDETMPAGLLSGKPVYTVYLPVGDTKDWVMHFSAANSSTVQKGGFVQLPDPRPLNAPYPKVTVRPTEPLSSTGPYLLVRGSIDETGAFQNLQLLGPLQTGAAALLEALSRWRFRPATRGANAPEKVQMVLAIPIQNI